MLSILTPQTYYDSATGGGDPGGVDNGESGGVTCLMGIGMAPTRCACISFGGKGEKGLSKGSRYKSLDTRRAWRESCKQA